MTYLDVRGTMVALLRGVERGRMDAMRRVAITRRATILIGLSLLLLAAAGVLLVVERRDRSTGMSSGQLKPWPGSTARDRPRGESGVGGGNRRAGFGDEAKSDHRRGAWCPIDC